MIYFHIIVIIGSGKALKSFCDIEYLEWRKGIRENRNPLFF